MYYMTNNNKAAKTASKKGESLIPQTRSTHINNRAKVNVAGIVKNPPIANIGYTAVIFHPLILSITNDLMMIDLLMNNLMRNDSKITDLMRVDWMLTH